MGMSEKTVDEALQTRVRYIESTARRVGHSISKPARRNSSVAYMIRQSYTGGHDAARPIQPRPLSRQIRQSRGAPSLFMMILSITRSLPENPSVIRPTIFSRWPLTGG
jgi:hypothetical protein